MSPALFDALIAYSYHNPRLPQMRATKAATRHGKRRFTSNTFGAMASAGAG